MFKLLIRRSTFRSPLNYTNKWIEAWSLTCNVLSEEVTIDDFGRDEGLVRDGWAISDVDFDIFNFIVNGLLLIFKPDFSPISINS
jgi:hypothetical protein